MLVTGAGDHTLKLWDAVTHACTAMLMGHAHYLSACAWSPDGRMIASGSWDNTLKLWNVEAGSCAATLQHDSTLRWCAWSPNGCSLASVAASELKVWDVTTRCCTATFQFGHLNRAAWSPDCQTVLLCGGPYVGLSAQDFGTVALWDVASRSCTATLGRTDGLSKEIYDCAWSPDGSRFVIVSADNTVKLWTTAAPLTCTSTLSGHDNWVLCCAWSPDGRIIASGSADKTLKLWDIDTGRCVATLETAHVRACAWSPNGRTLASGGSDRALTLWDVQRS